MCALGSWPNSNKICPGKIPEELAFSPPNESRISPDPFPPKKKGGTDPWTESRAQVWRFKHVSFSIGIFFNTWKQDRQKPIYVGPWAILPFWALCDQLGQLLSQSHLSLLEIQCGGRTNSEGLLAIPHSTFLLKKCEKSNFQGLLAMSGCEDSDWSDAQKSNFAGLLAMSHCPGSDWTSLQNSHFEGLLAMSLCPDSDRSSLQESKFEGLLAMPHCPGSDWSPNQKSNFEGLLAMSHCPGSDWTSLQKSHFEDLLAMSRDQGSDRTGLQKSKFEGLLAMSRCPAPD